MIVHDCLRVIIEPIFATTRMSLSMAATLRVMAFAAANAVVAATADIEPFSPLGIAEIYESEAASGSGSKVQ